MNSLPNDINNLIYYFYWEFQRGECINRISAFQQNYNNIWAEVMSDIRMNTPAYRIKVTNYQGLQISLYLRLPNCDVGDFDIQAIFNSWNYTIQRSALGMPRGLFVD